MSFSRRLDFKHRGKKRPPVVAVAIVSGPSVSSTAQTSTVVSWTLNVAATGKVDWGLTAGYGSSSAIRPSAITHAQTVSGLSPNTLYHYKVTGTDANSNTYDSGDLTFTTLADNPPVGGSLPSTIVTKQIIPLNSMPRPSVLVPSTDSVFGVQVTRLMNTANARPAYSSVYAWNCDGSLLALLWFQMFRGSDLTPLGNPSFGDKWSWSAITPTKAYSYVSPNIVRINTVSLTTGANTSTRNVTLTSPVSGTYTSIDWGGGEGKFSKNERFCFMWQKSGSAGLGIFDGVTERVVWEYTLQGTTSMSAIDHSRISWSGRYIEWAGTAQGTSDHQGTNIMDTVTLTRRQPRPAQEHGDFAQGRDGTDYFCHRNGVLGGFYRFRCSDGQQTRLTDMLGIHVSGTNILLPGYVGVSDYEGAYTGTATRGQLWLADLDDPSKGIAFGQTHLQGAANDTYDAQPRACWKPDGSQVAWGTRWQGDSTTYPYIAGVSLGL